MSEEPQIQSEADNQQPEESSAKQPNGLHKILSSFDEQGDKASEKEESVQKIPDDVVADHNSPDELPLPPSNIEETSKDGQISSGEKKEESIGVEADILPDQGQRQDMKGGSEDISSPDGASLNNPEQTISEAMKKLDKLLEDIRKNGLEP